MAQIISVFEVLVDKFIAKLAAHQGNGSYDDTEAKKKEFTSIWKSCVDTATVSVAWSDDASGGVTEIKPKKKSSSKKTSSEATPTPTPEADSVGEVGKCMYVATKGKLKGTTCGKKTVPGKKMCQSHKKAEDDVIRDDPESPVFGPQNKEEQTVSEDSKKCTYVATRGKNKGVACGNDVADGSDTCSKHTKKTSEPEPDADADKTTVVETKIHVVKKQNGRWVHVDSGFVFKSNKERVVVGKMTDGEYRDINSEDVADLEKYNFEHELK